MIFSKTDLIFVEHIVLHQSIGQPQANIQSIEKIVEKYIRISLDMKLSLVDVTSSKDIILFHIESSIKFLNQT